MVIIAMLPHHTPPAAWAQFLEASDPEVPLPRHKKAGGRMSAVMKQILCLPPTTASEEEHPMCGARQDSEDPVSFPPSLFPSTDLNSTHSCPGAQLAAIPYRPSPGVFFS
jgi:hypothetical protein